MVTLTILLPQVWRRVLVTSASGSCQLDHRVLQVSGKKQIMFNGIRRLPKSIMDWQITESRAQSGKTIAKQKKRARLVIRKAKQIAIKILEQILINKPARHINCSINSIKLAVGINMEKRGTSSNVSACVAMWYAAGRHEP